MVVVQGTPVEAGGAVQRDDRHRLTAAWRLCGLAEGWPRPELSSGWKFVNDDDGDQIS